MSPFPANHIRLDRHYAFTHKDSHTCPRRPPEDLFRRHATPSVRVLVTGHAGYIGSVLAPLIASNGHEVVGLDTHWFDRCDFGREPQKFPNIRGDVRDVDRSHLNGFDAVIHLAAVSNDPLGDVDPQTTFGINHEATVLLAESAKEAGVERFIFASSCSLYGRADSDEMLDESAAFNPVTPYGQSKVLAERDLALLADDEFSPTYMRNATAFGESARLRLDLVVNDFVAAAVANGEIVIKSDGTPWRPLVHIEDISLAALAALEAPRELVHNQPFNVGRNEDNLQVSQVAELVAAEVPGSRIVYADGGSPDARSYRVNFSKLPATIDSFLPRWSVQTGIKQLLAAFRNWGLPDTQAIDRFLRLKEIQSLQAEGKLDSELRWTSMEQSVAQ